MKAYSIPAALGSLLFVLSTQFASAQVNQGFEGGLTNLYNNCWQFSNTIGLTSVVNKGGPISGTESMITLPPVNEGIKDYLVTPYLDLSSLSLKVGFKYALNTKLAGSAYRLIRFGLVDKADNIVAFDSIHLNRTSPLSIISYSRTFILTSAVSKRFFIEFSGNTGDGNSRLIFDDLSLSADFYYGEGGMNACNAAPVAVDDVYLGVLGALVSGNLKKNDTEPNGELAVVNILTQPTEGLISLKNDGSFTFQPNLSFKGAKVEFTYQLNDNGYTPLISNIAKVTIDFSFSLLSSNLSGFTGKMHNSNVLLNWTVSNNESLARMEIEESRNGKDFNYATSVIASGKAGEEQYVYSGKAPFSANMVYRLKLVDLNNQVSYSKTLSLQSLTANTGSFIKSVSANSTENLAICFQSAADKVCNVRIVDITGKVIYVIKQTAIKGSNVINVPVSASLSKGAIYLVHLNDGNDSYVSKFIKS